MDSLTARRILLDRLPKDPGDDGPIPVPPSVIRAILPGAMTWVRFGLIVAGCFVAGRASK